MGCKVIIPVFADRMFMSSLGGFEQFCVKVYDPQELRKIIEKITKDSEKKENFNEVKKFILSYWCLNKSLKRWEKLLK